METRTNSVESIWRNHSFIKLFVAFGLSSLGDWFDLIAISNIMCYGWKVSPFVASLWGLTFSLPSLLFSQFAGVLADRVGQLGIIRICDAARCLLTFSLLMAPNPWWTLAVLTARGCVSVFNMPAQNVLNRFVVRDDQLLEANGINSTVSQLSKIIGPFLGAAVMGMTSPRICLVINSASFLISFVVLLRIKRVRGVNRLGEETFAQKDNVCAWGQGWQPVRRDRFLRDAILILVAVVLMIQIADTLWAVLLRTILPSNPAALGLLVSTVGVGALPCTLVMTRKKKIRSFRLAFGVGTMFMGSGFLCIGLFKAGWNPILLFVGALIMGIGVGVFYPSHNFLIQTHCPPEVLGRVYGILNSLTSLVIVIGPLLGGTIASMYGPSFTFALAGCLTIVVGGVVWICGPGMPSVKGSSDNVRTAPPCNDTYLYDFRDSRSRPII